MQTSVASRPLVAFTSDLGSHENDYGCLQRQRARLTLWAIKNRTAYAAERSWTRDKSGLHYWIVGVRASFEIALDGRLRLADTQLPLVVAPEYFGAPGTSSLRDDSDLLAPKLTTDVLLHANAHAPFGRAASVVPVQLRLGYLEKRLLVYGERTYYAGLLGLSTRSPAAFVSRPIRYELAYGGGDLSDPDSSSYCMDERNPVGRGFARRPADLVGKAAPAVDYPTGDPARCRPAGFGPIDAAWLPRRALAGTYDERWVRSKKPLLPDDYNPAYAQSAPTDQQTPQPLVGGERVELQNLTVNGRLVFEIPRITLRFTTHFGRRQQPHPVLLAKVLIEPEEQRLSLVWQSVLRVAALDLDYLDHTEISEPQALI